MLESTSTTLNWIPTVQETHQRQLIPIILLSNPQLPTGVKNEHKSLKWKILIIKDHPILLFTLQPVQKRGREVAFQG